MSVALEEALQAVDLEPGRIYRCQVRGQWIELQVLGALRPPNALLRPEDEVPQEAWTQLPEPTPVGVVHARLAPPDPPDIPPMPAEDEVP